LENLANYLFIGSIIGICILTLRIIRRRDDGDVRDPGLALEEFGKVYPNEAIRGALMDKTGMTTFMRLAAGKTGLNQTVGNVMVIRIIEPGSVGVELTEDGEGLVLNFANDSSIGGEYQFRTPEDAAEVSLWICGSFGQVMAETLNDNP
tara:strand:+ start:1368 stop:1814 length:447 start_codon:yes stop_codon:yes gene_type:complete